MRTLLTRSSYFKIALGKVDISEIQFISKKKNRENGNEIQPLRWNLKFIKMRLSICNNWVETWDPVRKVEVSILMSIVLAATKASFLNSCAKNFRRKNIHYSL